MMRSMRDAATLSVLLALLLVITLPIAAAEAQRSPGLPPGEEVAEDAEDLIGDAAATGCPMMMGGAMQGRYGMGPGAARGGMMHGPMGPGMMGRGPMGMGGPMPGMSAQMARDPKTLGRMLQLRGDMLKAMGDVLLKHGKALEQGQ